MSGTPVHNGDTRRQQYLQAMGIQVWQARRPVAVGAVAGAAVVGAAEPTSEAPRSPLPAEPKPAIAIPAVLKPAVEVASAQGIAVSTDISSMDWALLQETVSQCQLCDLHASRTQTVFGVGNRSAEWLVIGEAPGKDEDLQGEPFVGRAGQLLNAMLLAAGLQREQVYIANILKCRPPNNRDPGAEEVACCEPYLARQIALIQPRIILAVGRIAVQNLLKTDTPIGKLRGTVHHYADTGIPVVATYHPAYLLRSPLDKRKAWSDLQLAMATVAGSVQ
jgi:uracil-DNA glycosylase